jgi:DNA-binding response OmpR family regulator
MPVDLGATIGRAATASGGRDPAAAAADLPEEQLLSERILIVEDDKSIRTIVEYALRDAGFDIVSAERGDDALERVAHDRVDLVILDLMLPGMDGLEVCKRIRAERSMPIIILSARGEELDKVLGLELGADDYVTKPFSPRELVSRVKANLRRARLEPDRSELVRSGDLEIDPVARTVHRAGGEVGLTYSEFEILNKLAGSPRRVFTREELMNHLWDGSFYGDLRSVDVHVRHLRQKIEDDPSNPALIRTVRGVGYAFGGADAPAQSS